MQKKALQHTKKAKMSPKNSSNEVNFGPRCNVCHGRHIATEGAVFLSKQNKKLVEIFFLKFIVVFKNSCNSIVVLH